MCIEPTQLADGLEVSCRKCWQCRRRRVDDLVGRCIAESKFAKRTYAVTLTYDEDQGAKAVALVYADVQKFLKRLRFAGYNVRYIVCGEYGTKKNRAHWHIILFFHGEHPNPEQMKQIDYGDKPKEGEYRVQWKHWPHGYVYFQEPSWKSFQYVLKYVLKDQDERVKSTHIAMSKKPPLGEEYFLELAKQHVKEMIAPKNVFYKFREVRNSNNKIKNFCMQGATKDKFLRRIRWRWYKKYYPKQPENELFEEYFANEVKREVVEYEWEETTLNGETKLRKFPKLETEYETKRLHDDKKVRYITEQWVELDIPKDHWTNAKITEIRYQGIPGILFEHENEAEVYTENNGWQKIEAAQAEQVKRDGEIIQTQTRGQYIRELLNTEL